MKVNMSYRTGAAGIVLFFFFLLPSLVSLYHGLFEHRAVSCTSGIGVHYHEAEFACDFSDFTFSNSLIQHTVERLIARIPFIDQRSESYSVPSVRTQVLDRQRRGPPPFS